MPESKAQLLARMALARARVYCGLLGLPRNTLDGLPVSGEWTARDTLAHLAFWDDFRSHQLEQMLAGRYHDIDWTDADTINARVYAERRDWTMDRVVAAAQAARCRFLTLIQPFGDMDLDRSFDVGPGQQITLRAWIERRPRHDLMHLEPFEVWRQRTRPAFEPGPLCILEAALAAGRAALVACDALLTSGERMTRPVCGIWTWQDVLGHVADWELYGVEGLRMLAAGGRLETNPEEETWNKAHAAARRLQPYAQTWGDFLRARQELLAFLAGYDDAHLAQPAATPVPFLSRHYSWFSVCAQHDLEHAEVAAQALGAA